MKARHSAALAATAYDLDPKVTAIDVAKSELRHHKVLAAHASSKTLEDMLQGLAKTVQGLATKEQLQGLATREQLQGLATREQLQGLATTEQLQGLATTVEGLAKTVEGLAKTVEANREARSFNRRKLDNPRFAGQFIAIQKCSSNPAFAQRINQIPNQSLVYQNAGDLGTSPAFFPSTLEQMNALDATGVIRLMKYYESTFGIDGTTTAPEYVQYFKDWISS